MAKSLTNDGRKVLATVVATAGSTYRRPGARMLIMADRSFIGLLSGGCLEADLKLHAENVMKEEVASACVRHARSRQ
jgi:xanthine dehydrogenase accessory factor